MTATVKNIIPRTTASNSDATQYTATNCRTRIDKFTGTNTHTSAVTLSVNLVASGGSVATTNLVVKAKSIAAGETYTFPELVGQVLEPGGFISTIASTTSVVVISASGVEFT